MIPALNIARELKFHQPKIDIIFVGTSRGLESELVPREGFRLEMLPVVPLSRKPSLNWFRFPFALLKSIFRTIKIIKKERIGVVVATGGYAAGPAILASWLTGRPLLLCEQNSYPGLTSRVGSIFADIVCIGLSGSKQFFWKKSHIVETGNPVDAECSDKKQEQILEKFSLDSKKKILLITGGSQGSMKINKAVLEFIQTGGKPEEWSILWQTGKNKYYGILAKLSKSYEDVIIVPFITTMCEAFEIADLVVSRCGALSLSEIACYGIPAILVPYPFAAGDHQKKNAEAFEKKGAAVIIQDDKLDGNEIAKVFMSITCDSNKLGEMSKGMKELAKPEATNEIIKLIDGLGKNEEK